jgi:hypothetical protein
MVFPRFDALDLGSEGLDLFIRDGVATADGQRNQHQLRDDLHTGGVERTWLVGGHSTSTSTPSAA